VRRGIQLAIEEIKRNLDEQATKINTSTEVRNIALVSSNQDHNIADIIQDIYETVGLKGAISILDGDGYQRKSVVEYVEGLSIDSGFLSPYFSEDRQSISYGSETNSGNIYVAIVDGNVETERELLSLLEFAKKTMRPLLIFA